MDESGIVLSRRDRRYTDFLGVRVRLLRDGDKVLITRKDMLRVLSREFTLEPRQTRATISSLSSEEWVPARGGLNDPFCEAGSAENWCRLHKGSLHETKVRAGRLGGHPPKRLDWDVTPGSVW